MTPLPKYGEILKAARETAGIQQKALAESMGMHRAMLSDVELGKRLAFQVSRTRELAAVLNTPPVQLMTLAAAARGIDEPCLAALDYPAIEVLITLVTVLPRMSPAQIADLKKQIERV